MDKLKNIIYQNEEELDRSEKEVIDYLDLAESLSYEDTQELDEFSMFEEESDKNYFDIDENINDSEEAY